ncbi:MAG: helix-turn-helix domain-containing protein [Alteromonas macleodii]|nr:helix-turn-helix domain-containing protein [Alteromonas macleodii]
MEIKRSPFITSKEVARYLAINENNVRRSRSEGVLLGNPAPPHYKMGHVVRYREEDVRAWAENLRVGGLNENTTA